MITSQNVILNYLVIRPFLIELGSLPQITKFQPYQLFAGQIGPKIKNGGGSTKMEKCERAYVGSWQQFQESGKI